MLNKILFNLIFTNKKPKLIIVFDLFTTLIKFVRKLNLLFKKQKEFFYFFFVKFLLKKKINIFFFQKIINK